MALDAAVLVRAGSGLLFVLLGAAVLALARGRLGNRVMGAWCVAFGLRFVVVNVWAGLLGEPVAFRDFVASTWGPVTRGLDVALLGLTLALTATFPQRPTSRDRPGVAASLVVAALAAGAAAASFLLRPADAPVVSFAPDEGVEFHAFVGASVAVAVVLGLRHARSTDRGARDAAAVLTVALLAHPLFHGGIGLVRIPSVVWTDAYWIRLLGAAAVTVVWLRATNGPSPRFARSFALVPLALVLLGMLVGNSQVRASAPGLVRIGAVAVVAFAILRLRLLGYELAIPTAHKGTLTTIGLVGFFAVAQVAQEFLSGTMGLVLGGVAAGVLLFAAAPLQRAAERLASREVAVASPSRAAGQPAEDVYRAALRVAMHDGAITAAEERHLADVADGLGLSVAQTLRLRDEVAGELAGVP